MKKFWLSLILFILIKQASALSNRFRCMIRNSPATTMTIGWNQVSGSSPRVFYGTLDNGQEADRYTNHVSPQRIVHAKGMHNHFARLSNLKPNTAYYFVIQDSEGTSKRYWFKTLPDDHNSKLSVLCGGDSRNHQTARQNANKIVARVRPDVVLFAGDMTGGDTDWEWQRWMDDWQMIITKDGKIAPVLAARGNHERSDQSIVDMFDVPHSNVFYGVNFSRGLLHVYTLNSMRPTSGEQLIWLENELKKTTDVAWRLAQYHHPMRPHTKRKHEQEYLRRYWGPLFFKYGIQLALECDSHMSKITWPVRATNDKGESGYDEGFVKDEKGTVFIGEGGWGAPTRDADDRKRWTRAMGSFNQIKWLMVTLDKIDIRTIKTDNASEVGYLTESNKYNTLPTNTNLWKVGEETVVTLQNKKRSSFKPRKPQILTEILASDAKVKNGQVLVSWKSVYEVANMRFKVQRSTNKLFWSTIAVVHGVGASAKQEQSYSYKDLTFSQGGKCYYRILAIDKTNRELTKQDTEIRTWAGNKKMETIEANVNSGILMLDLDLDYETTVTIEIYDTKRKRVFEQEFIVKAGEQTIPLNVKHLNEGHYLLELSYDGKLIKKSIKLTSPSN
ncbi:MAG: metallophosphoesterase family protein [Aureispira sp.]|nr:metallophosphoesterase family protein [Aureispira sp.]